MEKNYTSGEGIDSEDNEITHDISISQNVSTIQVHKLGKEKNEPKNAEES